jgi:hypothetical protein
VEQFELFQFAIRTLERLEINYVVVGSCASISYGEPRMTQDIDIVIDATRPQLILLCEAFAGPEYYVSREAANSALELRSQFNVLHPDSGNKIDFIFPKEDAWSREQIAGRKRIPLFEQFEGYAARPEDIIIGKMIYYEEGGSEKHLRDITGMMRVSGELVDREYVERWAASLGLTEIWAAILKRLEGLGKDKME